MFLGQSSFLRSQLIYLVSHRFLIITDSIFTFFQIPSLKTTDWTEPQVWSRLSRLLCVPRGARYHVWSQLLRWGFNNKLYNVYNGQHYLANGREEQERAGKIITEIPGKKPSLETGTEGLSLWSLNTVNLMFVTSIQLDPSIIGGMIIDLGDKFIDMSTQTKIKKIVQTLSEAL